MRFMSILWATPEFEAETTPRPDQALSHDDADRRLVGPSRAFAGGFASRTRGVGSSASHARALRDAGRESLGAGDIA
jgi:hypothetical protein